MKARDLALLLALGILLAWLVPVWGQPPRAVAPRFRPETFVRLEGVSGESAQRPGWIEALSAMRFECRGRSFAFVHLVDRASPALAQAAAGGTHFAQAELDLGGVRFVLTDVLVSRITQASGARDRPAETVTLGFARCARR
ncbi:MAG: hypothetical protein A3E31_09310 [Candidatus Rokubacteria bacterium RIFCSPHIGHO2_12_FULL_73_22]|nr:MAG: hypothetical protein A3D33_05950 [Candidatus Rokubacteria bacterium RIFCSPHIGHO2_02_FULL_73_26]OGL02246.1 MAG: hypothetical protein A3E31_09310 [Candidatus Rokubacteria bacterium RIFCSPHIGHO2_12_FULL_73_22]